MMTPKLARKKLSQTRRKSGEALTAYIPYAEVVSRSATQYPTIYARERREEEIVKDEARGQASDDGVLACTSRSMPTEETKYLAIYSREKLAEQKLSQTRRKSGEALTAYGIYAEVVSRSATQYPTIYACERRREDFK